VPPKENKKPKGKFVCQDLLENGQICGKHESLWRRLDYWKSRCNDCWRKRKGEAVKKKLTDEERKK
jgi:hypothetical protein